ncbi:MAG: gluconokinase [Deinococcales bacterium]|nr:gluconokinase [Chitinophagaceae bacterium]
MGVSGVGKTTIGKLLATKTAMPFFDGDDFHPATSIAKMALGQALTDEDRKDWLQDLNGLIMSQSILQGCIIACSALKENYRKILSSGAEKNTVFVYLHGSYEAILHRLQLRKNHFIPTSLLQSQFDILDTPLNALQISINKSPEDIVSIIQQHLAALV